jgi:copper(I)-binding protein
VPGHHAFAGDFKVGPITIETPWSRATPGGAKVAAGYLTIKNDAATPDRLVSVTAEIAGRAGLHQMIMADGMMKMRELTDGRTANSSGRLREARSHFLSSHVPRPEKTTDDEQSNPMPLP